MDRSTKLCRANPYSPSCMLLDADQSLMEWSSLPAATTAESELMETLLKPWAPGHNKVPTDVLLRQFQRWT